MFSQPYFLEPTLSKWWMCVITFIVSLLLYKQMEIREMSFSIRIIWMHSCAEFRKKVIFPILKKSSYLCITVILDECKRYNKEIWIFKRGQPCTSLPLLKTDLSVMCHRIIMVDLLNLAMMWSGSLSWLGHFCVHVNRFQLMRKALL